MIKMNFMVKINITTCSFVEDIFNERFTGRKKNAIYLFIHNFVSKYVTFIECGGQTDWKEENVIGFACANHGRSAEGKKA